MVNGGDDFRMHYNTGDAVELMLGPDGTDGDVFVCGSAGFADAATTLLVGLGVTPTRIRVERFGPTGAVAV